MPVATVSNEPQYFELKSAPPDGYIKAIPLPFGKLLHRRDKASKMTMQQQQSSNRRGRRTQETDDQQLIGIEFANEWSRWYEFSECIVDHNLTDVNGAPIDFKNKMAFQMLDPKIGQEIELHLDSLNREEDEETLENFPQLAAVSSSTENGSNDTSLQPS